MKKCSLCGKQESMAKFMIRPNNSNVLICNFCAADISTVTKRLETEIRYNAARQMLVDDVLCNELEYELPNNSANMKRPSDVAQMPTPMEIVNILNKRIVGQDEAKKALAIAAYHHHQRMKDGVGLLKKNNIMLIGPTGSGKTLIAKELAKILNVPFIIADATSFTQAGYIGDDVEQILTRLIDEADGDVERAEVGIVFLDEVDKLAKKVTGPSGARDAAGEGVQHALLKIVEGSNVPIMLNRFSKQKVSPITLDTKNILFICGGAFPELKQNGTQRVGFLQPDKPTNDQVSTELLVNYGMVPEFVGRFPVVCQLNQLTHNDLIAIMTETEDSIINEYKYLFGLYEMQLSFTQQAICTIADIAFSLNTGARALRGIFEILTRDLLFNPTQKEVQIDQEYVVSCFGDAFTRRR